METLDVPIALTTLMTNDKKFLFDNGWRVERVYTLVSLHALPFEEGAIDDETFVKYGIITGVNYREAVQRHSVRESRWYSATPVS